MATPPIQAPAGAQRQKYTASDSQMFGLLREIRSSAQYLQKEAADALVRTLTLDAAARAASLAKALPAALLTRVDNIITPQLDAIRTVFLEDVREFEWCSDSVTAIGLTWARVKDRWPAADTPFEESQQRLGFIAADLDVIVFRCAELTLSPRINETLENLRVGQPLDFEFEFGDELPVGAELRKRLLLELAQEAKAIQNGVIDVSQEVIYKAAASRNAQRRSVFELVALIVCGGLVIPLLVMPWIFQIMQQPDGRIWNISANLHFVVNYVLIFIGSGIHLLIEAVKSQRAESKPSFQAMNDWVLWLHVREMPVFWGIVYIWIGYVLLSAGIPGLSPQTAFFAGYSIDSITEVFLDRFQTAAKAQAAALTAMAK
ncbi:MAG TPA: hypothetical protein VG675_24420 [Bryobacteraceae bacterium]|nr:hypothetical protein [Bryobacteraceae bacterium]